jgi:hypothetical protein
LRQGAARVARVQQCYWRRARLDQPRKRPYRLEHRCIGIGRRVGVRIVLDGNGDRPDVGRESGLACGCLHRD